MHIADIKRSASFIIAPLALSLLHIYAAILASSFSNAKISSSEIIDKITLSSFSLFFIILR